MDSYKNGFLMQKKDGKNEGTMCIDGVDISPIEGMYFAKGPDVYLWLKRKPILVYDEKTMSFLEKTARPKWEVYLKRVSGETHSYIGEFMFLRFKYKIFGIWDRNFGKDKKQINFFVERMPMNKQSIIQKTHNRND